MRHHRWMHLDTRIDETLSILLGSYCTQCALRREIQVRHLDGNDAGGVALSYHLSLCSAADESDIVVEVDVDESDPHRELSWW